jgi:general secretion pathway protein D
MSRRCGNISLRRLSAITLAVLVTMVSGCAGQLALRDGANLVAADQVEAGLAVYQNALLQDASNTRLRMAYVQTLERAIQSYLERAEKLYQEGRWIDAEMLFQRALGLSPRNERARAGLAAIERDGRHAALVAEGAAELRKGNLESARMKLSNVLSEDPKNPEARALLATLESKDEASAKESVLAANFRKPISIDFKDAQLKQVFEAVASSSGMNFLFDKDIKLDQKTSIMLKNSTIEAALYYILMTNQLDHQVMDTNTLLIYPNNAGKQKEYQQLVVKKFPLLNANAKAIAETLKTLMKPRDLVIDEKLNMLIMRDSPDAIRLAGKLIALQDVAQPEVMLELEVLEVSRTRLQELGIAFPGSLTLVPLATSTGGTLKLSDLRNLNSDNIGATVDPLKLNARAVDSDTGLLANPRIRVLDREKARVVIGNRVPTITTAITATGIISESVSYIDVGLKLDVEPTIFLDNDVAIRVGLEVSSVVDQQKTTNGTTTYTIGTRSATTVLRLKDGENQVLAGLINDEDRRAANKLPGLGDLPLIGRLFGSNLTNANKTEIVLSITPRLIRNNRRQDAALVEFLSGTETSARRRPETAVQPVAAPEVKGKPVVDGAGAASPVANPSTGLPVSPAAQNTQGGAATVLPPVPQPLTQGGVQSNAGGGKAAVQ